MPVITQYARMADQQHESMAGRDVPAFSGHEWHERRTRDAELQSVRGVQILPRADLRAPRVSGIAL